MLAAMRGRFTNRYTWRELIDLYLITEPYIHPISNLEPRFNFAPVQRGVVVRLDEEGRREQRLAGATIGERECGYPPREFNEIAASVAAFISAFRIATC